MPTPAGAGPDEISAGPRAGETLVVVTVDTEEDNWTPARDGVTVENIRELPRFQAICGRLGVRPTYFVAYQVMESDWAGGIIRDLHDSGEAEVAAHLHPWNTPPHRESPFGRNTMLCNLPAELQLAKLEALTERAARLLGTAPTTFRAGRFGLGRDTLGALIRCGYRVDSSVTPFCSWGEYDDGPDFVGAPVHPYRLTAGQDPCAPAGDGELVEIPVSAGFSRNPFHFWAPVHRVLGAEPWHHLRAAGMASRLGIIRKVMLTPENERLEDLLLLSRRIVESGVPHLNLILHSSSLRAGLSQFTPTRADVDRMLGDLEEYLERLAAMMPVRFVTVGEAAASLFPSSAPIKN